MRLPVHKENIKHDSHAKDKVNKNSITEGRFNTANPRRTTLHRIVSKSNKLCLLTVLQYSIQPILRTVASRTTLCASLLTSYCTINQVSLQEKGITLGALNNMGWLVCMKATNLNHSCIWYVIIKIFNMCRRPCQSWLTRSANFPSEI